MLWKITISEEFHVCEWVSYFSSSEGMIANRWCKINVLIAGNISNRPELKGDVDVQGGNDHITEIMKHGMIYKPQLSREGISGVGVWVKHSYVTFLQWKIENQNSLLEPFGTKGRHCKHTVKSNCSYSQIKSCFILGKEDDEWATMRKRCISGWSRKIHLSHNHLNSVESIILIIETGRKAKSRPKMRILRKWCLLTKEIK